jgi:ribonucleoside-diphosphate reductase beta chain
MNLQTQKTAFKPFYYPWAYECWKKQQQIHWIVDEVDLGQDVQDWENTLSPSEKEFLTQIFRFFTQADIDVNNNYMENYSRIFKPTEIKMMLSAFSNMETVHIDAYALLIETVGMPESEYEAFLNYKEMREKHEYLSNFNMSSPREILKTLAAFGAFTEGLQLYASFAMLLNFPRFGKMKGMGQVVTWSVRDESLHCIGIINLFHTYATETGALDDSLKKEIVEIAKRVVELEDNFIDLAFKVGGIRGMEADDIKAYIRYVADWRLEQLKMEPIYNIKQHPIPWLKEILNGVEHANFFEVTATEYSKAATKGDWKSAWDSIN